jgi:hypothetical protein
VTGPPSDRIPDGITPLVGYRAWQVAEEATGLVFYPLSHRSREWVDAPRGWAVARCPLDDEARLNASRFHAGWLDGVAHDAPGESCSCGFYAMKELHPHLVRLVAYARRAELTPRSQGTFVLGRVELAGKVIEHARGYRAERARIAELIPLRGTERAVESIARRVGVGVGSPVKPTRRLDLPGRLRALRWALAMSRSRSGEMSGGAVALWLVAILAYALAFVVHPADPGNSPMLVIALGAVVSQVFVRLRRLRATR